MRSQGNELVQVRRKPTFTSAQYHAWKYLSRKILLEGGRDKMKFKRKVAPAVPEPKLRSKLEKIL